MNLGVRLSVRKSLCVFNCCGKLSKINCFNSKKGYANLNIDSKSIYTGYFTKNDCLYYKRNYSNQRKGIILGIETSCDDTGCAIVDTDGNLLGDALNSQHLIHLNYGGIIPPVAEQLHRQNIEKVVGDAVRSANISFEHVDAIATTVKPGMPASLLIGTKYGKYLCRKYHKPFIPIHHMEAHALTARMQDKSVQFPFLVLLISGGHCLLALAKGVNDFLLLGSTIDDAPGEAFDKMARRMKLKNLPEFSKMNGGQAIELAASRATDPWKFKFTIPMLHYKDCNFSFSGMKNTTTRHVIAEEQRHGLAPDTVIPDINNLCAGFQMNVARHLCHRVQRAMEFVERKEMIPADKKTLVVSGGAACNNFIAKALSIVCNELGYAFVRPPPKLCTDNGVMIAWNGVEKWRADIDITSDLDSIDVQKSCPLGKNIIEEVAAEQISPKWVRLSTLTKPQKDWDLKQAEMVNF